MTGILFGHGQCRVQLGDSLCFEAETGCPDRHFDYTSFDQEVDVWIEQEAAVYSNRLN